MFHNPLASLAYAPTQIESVSFETQNPSEQVRLMLRRHFVTNIPWLTTALLLILLPKIIFSILPLLSKTIIPTSILTELQPYEQLTLLTTYFILVVYYTLFNLLEWYFTVIIVTNQRVINFVYSAPFTQNTTQAQLEEIQDVHATQRGAFATIFDYGNLSLQTAGSQQTLALNRIPKPNHVHNLIISLLP